MKSIKYRLCANALHVLVYYVDKECVNLRKKTRMYLLVPDVLIDFFLFLRVVGLKHIEINIYLFV